MPPQKRPREVIDLTDDDPAVGKSAKPRLAAPSSQSSLYSSRPSQRGPGLSSSYASSSQPFSSNGSSSRGSGLAYSQTSLADEDPEAIDLTQADDGPALQIYGTIDNKIVGCRYYDGIVSPGELVVLRREPSNPSVFHSSLPLPPLALCLLTCIRWTAGTTPMPSESTMSWDLRSGIYLASSLRSSRPIVSSSWTQFLIFSVIRHLFASELLDKLQLVRQVVYTCLSQRFGS